MSVLQKQLNDYDDKLCAADEMDLEIEQVSSDMYDALSSAGERSYAYKDDGETVTLDDFMWEVGVNEDSMLEVMNSGNQLKIDEFNDKVERKLVGFCEKKAKEILKGYYL